MLALSRDILKTGEIRYSHSEEKLIPAVLLDFLTDSGDLNIVVLPLESIRVRAIIEVLCELQRGTISSDIVELILTQDIFDKSEDDLRQPIKEVRKLRQQPILNSPTSKIQLGTHLTTLIIKQLKACSCAIYQLTEGDTQFDLRRLSDLKALNWERLLSDFPVVNEYRKYLATGSERLGFSMNVSFYKEDILFGKGTHTLESYKAVSGDKNSELIAVKKLYEEHPYFSANRDLFVDSHCACGAELVARLNYTKVTSIYCVNPFCFEKIGLSLNEMTTSLNYKGIGENMACDVAEMVALEKLYYEGDINIDYIDLLNSDLANSLNPTYSALWNGLLNVIQGYKGSLKDLIKIQSLPYVDDIASKILTLDFLDKNPITPMDVYNLCVANGKYEIKFILNLYYYMDSIKHLLNLARNSLDLIQYKELPIYITQGVVLKLKDGTVYEISKAKYIDMLNEILANNYTTSKTKVVIQKGVTKSSIALIADKGGNTGSVSKAIRYGVPIVSSTEFYYHILEMGVQNNDE